MKFRLTQVGAAAALTVAASSAMALPATATPNRPLANYTAGTTDIYLSGSSAVDLALTKFIAKACDAGSLDVYRSDNGPLTSYLWTCESSTPAGFQLPANTKIAIHKNTNSSADGTNGLLNTAANFSYLQVSDLTAATNCPAPAVTVGPSFGIPAYLLTSCATTAGAGGTGTLSHKADFGFSDSEPKQFISNLAQIGQVKTAYPFGLIFGIPVSLNVRDALQNVQFPGILPGDRELDSKIPSITSAQVNAIGIGTYSTWQDALGVSVGGDNNIYRVRRSNGSGTTRTYNATFIGEFCTPGLQGNVVASPGGLPTNCVPTGVGDTKQMGTSDDMATCIANYNAAGVGAIGHLSTDYQPGVGDGYRFVKIDGNTPNLLNVINGQYKMWSELSFNYNNTAGIPAGSDKLAFYNRFKTASGDVNYLSAVDQGLTQTAGGTWTGGIFGSLQNAKNATGWGVVSAPAYLNVGRTDASVLLAPVNPLTRATSFSGYNLCAPAFNAAQYQSQ